MLHDSHYTLNNVINVGEISLAMTIVENLDGLALTQLISKTEICHVWSSCRTIDIEETKPCRWNVIELRVGMSHKLIAFLGCCIEFTGLGLSLDMLIYIIRYGKPEADDCRFNL